MASRKRFKTADVLQMLDLSDDEYFEKVDSDHQVNEREQDCEADTPDSKAYNTQHKT
mgnify:CR=1 FL=1